MPTRDARDPEIKFDTLGGLDERPAQNALESPNFDLCHGLYQSKAGALQRVEGTEWLATLRPTEAQHFSFGPGIWRIYQLTDGTNNIMVQTADGAETIFTLDELFHRPVISALTYDPNPDEESMPTARIVQSATNGTSLATIGGSSASTWYQRPLTALSLNESSIVVAFTGNQFTVAPGTYRIRGYTTASFTINVTGGATANSGEFGFQAVISDTTNSVTLTTGSPEKAKFSRDAASGTQCNIGPVNLKSVFDDSFDIVGVNAVLEVRNAFSSTVTNAGTVTVTGGQAAGVSTTINGAATAQPYTVIILSKVA